MIPYIDILTNICNISILSRNFISINGTESISYEYIIKFENGLDLHKTFKSLDVPVNL